MRLFDVSRTGYTPKIRIINLVDILFILLLFFIATTTFRMEQPNAVKLSLPEAKTAEALGKRQANRLLISVSADGTLYVGQERMALDRLEKTLREAKTKNPEVQLEFSADKSASYGTVVAVVDAARAAGIGNITAFTKKSVR